MGSCRNKRRTARCYRTGGHNLRSRSAHEAKRPSPPEPLAGRRDGPKHTRQQEMKIMNALAHWIQFKELEALHNSLGSLFGRHQVPRPEGHEETPVRVA